MPKKIYKLTIKTDNLALARKIAKMIQEQCDNAPPGSVTTFDAPLPSCGGPGDPC
jgi:hypothetical protein